MAYESLRYKTGYELWLLYVKMKTCTRGKLNRRAKGGCAHVTVAHIKYWFQAPQMGHQEQAVFLNLSLFRYDSTGCGKDTMLQPKG